MASAVAHLGLTGTASLAEDLDSARVGVHTIFPSLLTTMWPLSPCAPRPHPTERMLVVLRDGRKIIGLMRSFDQFANIVLEQACERIIIDKRFADVPLGLYVIRGENVVLIGEMVRLRSGIGPPYTTPWHFSHLATVRTG